MSEVKTVNEQFHFRVIKATASKFAEAVAAFKAAGVSYTEEKDGDIVTGIVRDSVEYELPVLDVAEVAEKHPNFLADLLHEKVVDAARKLYVDELKPVGELTLDMIVAANTRTPKVTIPKEHFNEFAAFITDNMSEKGANAGTIQVVGDLIKGRFNTPVLSKYVKIEEQFPVILSKLAGYVTALGEAEGAEYAEAYAKFAPVYENVSGNYQRWLDTQNSSEEELDFDII